MNDLDSFNYSFITNVIKDYFEYIDEYFFHTSYRQHFCESIVFYERRILTLFGEIRFKRRYYYDKKYHDRFYFTDLFLGLPKRKYFDPFVCSEICNESASFSYSKAGKIVSDKVGKKINNNLFISRASSRNIVLKFGIKVDNPSELKRVGKLFVIPDEKFFGSQFNEGLDHMVKASVIFEDIELVYKYKKKPHSINRYKLINSHTCASIDNELLNDTIDYILNNWNERQIYQNNSYMRCSMKSHIPHIFADLFTSRPKAYSKKGLRQLLKLRLLKANRKDIKQLYLNNLKSKYEKTSYTSRYIKDRYDYEVYDSSQIFNFLYQDNLIHFI